MFQSEWVTSDELRQRLGISRTTLWRIMESGLLKPAAHYFRIHGGKRSPLRFNYPSCILALGFYTTA